MAPTPAGMKLHAQRNWKKWLLDVHILYIFKAQLLQSFKIPQCDGIIIVSCLLSLPGQN